MPKPIPAILVLHGPTTLKVMHCADLESAKAAVISLVRERGDEESLKARIDEWSDRRDRGYTVYLVETLVGELVEIH
jgi:hypothetical protein